MEMCKRGGSARDGNLQEVDSSVSWPLARLVTVENVGSGVFEVVKGSTEDAMEVMIRTVTVASTDTSSLGKSTPSGIGEPKSVFLDGVVISYRNIPSPSDLQKHMNKPPPSFYETYVTMGIPDQIMSALEIARNKYERRGFSKRRHETRLDPTKIRRGAGYSWIDVNIEGPWFPFVVISERKGQISKHVIKELGIFMSNMGSSLECKVHCFLRYRRTHTERHIRPEACMWELVLDPICIYVTRSWLGPNRVSERVDMKECICTSKDILSHFDGGR